MPIASCPHCRTELEIDSGDFGYRVQCPACQSAFTPEDPAARPAPSESARRTPPPPPPPAAEPGTKVITCSECRGQVTVAVEDLGHSMQCPLCDKVFLAADPDRPARRSGRGDERDDGGGRPWRPGSGRGGRMPRYDEYDDRPSRRSSRGDDDDDDYRPRRRRSRFDDYDDSPGELVSYAQQECSAAGVGLLIIAVWGLLSGVGLLVLYGVMLGGGMGPMNGAGGLDETELVINMAACVYQILASAFILYAGILMRQAKQYTVCMIACIVVMIPAVSPCCLLGLIFGIMGVTKLNESRVKRGFEANKPGFDADGYN